MAETVKSPRITWTWSNPAGLLGYMLRGYRDDKVVARYDPGCMSGLVDVLNDYEERLADAIAEVDRCHERAKE